MVPYNPCGVTGVPNIQASYTINSHARPPPSQPPRAACPERSKTENDSEGPGLDLSDGAHTAFLLERDDLGTSPWQDVWAMKLK
jgi:hypothetical protein